MKFTRQSLYTFVFILLVFRPLTCPAWVIDSNECCTWGIPNSELVIPARSLPVGAILTLHNLYADPSVPEGSLSVHLLNNPSPGLAELAETGSSDPFEGHGAPVGTFWKSASAGQDLTINLSQVNHPQSWTRSVFPDSFTQTLGNQETISYSSSLLELLDYAGSGQSFGFGLQSRGLTCSGMTLQVTIQSLDNASDPTILEYRYGNIYAPQLESIPDYSISRGQIVSFTVSASDADGDTLVCAVDGLPAGAAFTDQTFTWIPTEAQGGTWEVWFSVSDGLLTDSQRVFITVTTSNQAPVLDFPQEVTLVEKEFLSLPIVATDPDGDPVSITAVNLPNGAVFNGSVLTWRTFFGNLGTYEITFIATDGQAEDRDTLILTVLPAKLPDWYKKR